MKLFEYVRVSAVAVAQSCDYCPIKSTGLVFIYFLLFSLFEAGIEQLIFGDRFLHWLDPLFSGVFIAYAACTVWVCALRRGP